MGRLRRRNKYQRSKARKEAGRRPEAPASDPESCGPALLKAEDQYSSCTNSCDETLYPLRGLYDGKQVEQAPKPRHIPADEMEVTHKLSCLNFSVRPGDLATSPHHHPASNLALPMVASVGFDVVSDGEGCSELPSATHLDLLPTLSDRGDGMEGVECHYRHARKRPARRKTNRKAKKFRYINSRDASFGKAHGNSVSMATPQQPLPLGGAGSGSGVLRTPRAKHSRSQKEEDPLSCCLSDTSVGLDLDTSGRGGHHNNMEGVETTPPTMEAARICDDTVPVESELSESTSDSGCEGDDEESSVEGPVNTGPLLQSLYQPPAPGEVEEGGWLHEGYYYPVRTSVDRELEQLLATTFPLLACTGRQRVEQEFKHPGRLGVCGGRSSGGRKKRSKPGDLVCPFTLTDINQKIIEFVQDPSADELKFNFVSRPFCKTIASLAQVYQLECVVEQKRRLPVASPRLHKTPHTRMATLQEVESILTQHGGRERMAPSPLLSNMDAGPPSRASKATPRIVPPPCQPVTPPGMVSAGHRLLDESNVGNRMLQNMGWRPGAGLGAESDGIRSPVRAHFRTKHSSGLGFPNHE